MTREVFYRIPSLKGSLPHSRSASRPAPFHSLLIPFYFSPMAERILGRAALLPLAQKRSPHPSPRCPEASPAGGQAPGGERCGGRLFSWRGNVARQAPEERPGDAQCQGGRRGRRDHPHARSCKAELIVMGRGGGACAPRHLSGIDRGACHQKGAAARTWWFAFHRASLSKRPVLALDTNLKRPTMFSPWPSGCSPRPVLTSGTGPRL